MCCFLSVAKFSRSSFVLKPLQVIIIIIIIIIIVLTNVF